ncbi:type II toxin-antitoxin system VapC family toxin [Iamia sp.]|uniref:type II toxin-antitoxin system VapC family toxin n=1 Tax=Iamia sp. TaxID=2722710 RepID=UPI002D0F53C0|nr:PIN domain-containing protein [Iamia sp.]HXH56519.1 PIN domain-containing protein [Iamia sp.]
MRFVDTSFWVALFFARDPHHDDARELWSQRPGGLLTTNHVLGETWTFLRRRRGHGDALRAVEAVEASRRVTRIRVPGSAEDDAWEWLRRRDDREYSFVDATSFAVMRRRRIGEALAYDGDFSAAGFVELRSR